MGYIALKPIRFAGRILQPGQSVPVEPGRNYDLMLRVNEIAVVPDDGTDILSPHVRSSHSRSRKPSES